MTEDFLHYIWRYRLLNTSYYELENGQKLEILTPGFHNTDAGPDFLNARIRLDGTTWAGNIEIHTSATDWYKHKHQQDLKYDNIILHVVYEDDVPIKRNNEELITTLCVKNCFDEKLFSRYKELLASSLWIPCEKNLSGINQNLMNIWKEKLVVARLQKKSEEIEKVLLNNKNDWSQTFYEFLFRNFGFKINAIAFEMLAKSLPISYLAKHKDSLFQTEALLFGQAGFLNDTLKDEYPRALLKEYKFLKQKFSVNPINHSLWNLLRLRPYNFPQIRIAQLASLLHNSSVSFSKVIEAENVEFLSDMFSVECSDYWRTHYLFDKESPTKNCSLGKSSIENIIINTIVPFLFAYGTLKNEFSYKDRALTFLENLSVEKNHIIRNWDERGIIAKTAWDSQALIALKNSYCSNKKCLDCMMGDAILRS